MSLEEHAQWVIVYGDVNSGEGVVGPFDTEAEAENYADKKYLCRLEAPEYGE